MIGVMIGVKDGGKGGVEDGGKDSVKRKLGKEETCIRFSIWELLYDRFSFFF